MMLWGLDTILSLHPLHGISPAAIVAQLESAENLPDRVLADITLRKIFHAILTVLIAYGSLSLVQGLTNWVSEKVARRFRLLIKQALPFLKALILLVAISHLVHLFINFSQANFFALTGTIAVALGFAFKDYVSSIIAGVVALFEAPYRVGDRVRIEDDYGEVVSYGLRGIRLQTPDDNTVSIPHSKTWTQAISNANSGSLEAQVATDFYFDHRADAEQILRILYQAAYSSKYTQLKLPIRVVMKEHLWGTQFKLRAYPMDARDEFVYKTDLIRRAKQEFARQGCPYPQIMGDAERAAPPFKETLE